MTGYAQKLFTHDGNRSVGGGMRRAHAPRRRNKDKEDPTIRSLQGQVNDSDEKPVAGAVVQLKDARTLQVRSFITQADGSYRFSGLRTDTDYEIKADYNGMSSDDKRLSNFDTRKIATVNLKLNKKTETDKSK